VALRPSSPLLGAPLGPRGRLKWSGDAAVEPYRPPSASAGPTRSGRVRSGRAGTGRGACPTAGLVRPATRMRQLRRSHAVPSHPRRGGTRRDAATHRTAPPSPRNYRGSLPRRVAGCWLLSAPPRLGLRPAPRHKPRGDFGYLRNSGWHSWPVIFGRRRRALSRDSQSARFRKLRYLNR